VLTRAGINVINILKGSFQPIPIKGESTMWIGKFESPCSRCGGTLKNHEVEWDQLVTTHKAVMHVGCKAKDLLVKPSPAVAPIRHFRVEEGTETPDLRDYCKSLDVMYHSALPLGAIPISKQIPGWHGLSEEDQQAAMAKYDSEHGIEKMTFEEQMAQAERDVHAEFAGLQASK
jgi:hypothetical protein